MHDSASRQRGAILVTSMLLLLVLTVLGVAMMRMTNLQERMAGNTRDMTLALQGAEAALRDGEERLRVLTVRPVATSSIPCTVCQRGTLPLGIDNPAVFDWAANATEFGTGAKDIEELAADPRFVTEELAFVRDSLLAGQEAPEGRDFYQVTSRSTGATGLSNVVLQSTYTRRF